MLDELRIPVRQIGDGALDDLTAFAKAFAQQDGRRRVAIGDGFDVHGLHGSKFPINIKEKYPIYMGTIIIQKKAKTRASSCLSLNWVVKLRSRDRHRTCVSRILRIGISRH